jgi:hypothetical protein
LLKLNPGIVAFDLSQPMANPFSTFGRANLFRKTLSTCLARHNLTLDLQHLNSCAILTAYSFALPGTSSETTNVTAESRTQKNLERAVLLTSRFQLRVVNSSL